MVKKINGIRRGGKNVGIKGLNSYLTTLIYDRETKVFLNVPFSFPFTTI